MSDLLSNHSRYHQTTTDTPHNMADPVTTSLAIYITGKQLSHTLHTGQYVITIETV
jgi:hypothetical protein